MLKYSHYLVEIPFIYITDASQASPENLYYINCNTGLFLNELAAEHEGTRFLDLKELETESLRNKLLSSMHTNISLFDSNLNIYTLNNLFRDPQGRLKKMLNDVEMLYDSSDQLIATLELKFRWDPKSSLYIWDIQVIDIINDKTVNIESFPKIRGLGPDFKDLAEVVAFWRGY